MNSTIELVSFKLKVDADEKLFKEIQPQLNSWVKRQKGFYYRTLIKEENGQFSDIVHWASEDAAKAANEKFMQQDFASAMMALVDADSVKMRHTQSLSEIGCDCEAASA